VEKYRNPPITEEFVSPMTKTSEIYLCC
jgi:hypothetical protein